LSPPPQTPGRTVTVVGGGVAGLSAACALAEAGFTVQVAERRAYWGGRASSFRHPGAGEVIDNCQHVLFGCCTNLLGFYRRIGVADQILWTSEMTMIEPGGRRTVLGPSPLPAPLHALPRFLAARAFKAADKLAIARAFAALLRPVPADSTESLAAWLTRHRQTPRARERFWRLVIASALNADLEAIALPYAAKVIRELFLASPEAGRMGMSRVPLTELYAGARRFLTERGAALHLNTAVTGGRAEPSGRWTLETSAGPLTSDYVVLALPFAGLASLLPRLPAAPGAAALAGQVGRLEHWPICSVHLWFDRPVTDLDHAVLLDREIHWMYNKSRIQPQRAGPGSYLELVVSASRSFAARSGEEAVAVATAELAEYFPAVRGARVEKALRIKEVHATFGVPPGIDADRPAATSPWPGLFLAGDWTATGWPSTMESAARSGHLAAGAVSGAAGEPRRFLDPDLPPSGLMARAFPGTPKTDPNMV